MLNKSKRSAIIISAAAISLYVLLGFLFNLLLPYWLSGDQTILSGSGSNSTQQMLLLAASLLGVAALLVALGAYWLHRFFGPHYFGLRGLMFWLLFALLLSLSLHIDNWLLGERWPVLQRIWTYVCVVPVFFLTRRLAGIKK